MSINLHLLRHAIAVDRGTPGYEDDRLRPLTDEGRSKMKGIAAGMKALGLSFDLILTSPYVRARETADIVAAALREKGRLRSEPSLQADRSPQEFLARLSHRYANRPNILAIGHEPFLSSLATLLLGLPGGAALALKKGGLCRLNVAQLRPNPMAQLEWLLTPKQLRKMG